tara:strand:+ start:9709 stop:9915 length:207 start_codon:yes stop_codon:yes gene_type:complete
MACGSMVFSSLLALQGIRQCGFACIDERMPTLRIDLAHDSGIASVQELAGTADKRILVPSAGKSAQHN